MKHFRWIRSRRILIAAVCLFWIGYFSTFFLLRGFYVVTEARVTKRGSAHLMDTTVWYFARRPLLNRFFYWSFFPVHRFMLGGRTVAEWDADIASNSMTDRDVYIEDVGGILQEEPWVDKFFTL